MRSILVMSAEERRVSVRKDHLLAAAPGTDCRTFSDSVSAMSAFTQDRESADLLVCHCGPSNPDVLDFVSDCRDRARESERSEPAAIFFSGNQRSVDDAACRLGADVRSCAVLEGTLERNLSGFMRAWAEFSNGLFAASDMPPPWGALNGRGLTAWYSYRLLSIVGGIGEAWETRDLDHPGITLQEVLGRCRSKGAAHPFDEAVRRRLAQRSSEGEQGWPSGPIQKIVGILDKRLRGHGGAPTRGTDLEKISSLPADLDDALARLGSSGDVHAWYSQYRALRDLLLRPPESL